MLIYLDGIDGCGKTTLCNILTNYYTDMTVVSLLDDTLDRLVEEQCVDGSKDILSASSVLRILVAGISSYYERVIPATNQYHYVVVDRCAASYWAYQVRLHHSCFARKLFDTITSSVTFRPDLYIYCNVDVQVAMKRIANRDHIKKPDCLDLLSIDDKLTLLQGYNEFNEVVAKRLYWPVDAIDCNKPIHTVTAELVSLVEQRRC